MYYVYLIKSKKVDKSYIGYTSDLRKRFKEHNSGEGGKYTKNKAPFELIYYEAYRSQKDARKREYNLKLYKKAHAQLKLRISNSLEEL